MSLKSLAVKEDLWTQIKSLAEGRSNTVGNLTDALLREALQVVDVDSLELAVPGKRGRKPGTKVKQAEVACEPTVLVPAAPVVDDDVDDLEEDDSLFDSTEDMERFLTDTI